MPNNDWHSAITLTAPNEVRLRGYRIDELMGRVDFGQALYLLLRGELPDEKVGCLVTAMLVASIDHGPTPPSAVGSRNAALTGAPLNACVASGILSINRYHGGAIEDCASTLNDVISRADSEGLSLMGSAEKVLKEYKEQKIRVAGYGHRVHTADPRTSRLFELAKDAGVAERHIQACHAVEQVLEKQTGRKLPINVDGAIGAVLAGLGFEPEIMNGFFMLARVGGLLAHAREEQTREKFMRRIDYSAWSYDGPEPRSME